jgi:alpha-glucosidase
VDDAVVYQIFPDRFARGSGSPALTPRTVPEWAEMMDWDAEPAVHGPSTAHQLFGGDLEGIIEHLDHVQSLGANTIYLTPLFPSGSVHRYDASTFDDIDALLGGREALVRLGEAVHARGMRFILDLTTNHTGDTHEWFRRAQADADSVEAGFYLFTEHPDGYEMWLDVPSLPKLDHRSEALRERMLRGPGSVVGRYLAAPFLADGWRIDVANMTARSGAVDLAHQVARDIRATMREVTGVEEDGRERAWLIAEHGHDASADLVGDGWMGTMNYVGFTRPVWAWLSDPDNDLNWLGLPMSIPHLSGRQIGHTLRDYNAHLPFPSWKHSQSQLSSHDTPRTRSVVGTRERQIVALGALATLPGVPTVFAGDEFGFTGRTGEHGRTSMPWEGLEGRGARAGAIDQEVLRATRELLVLRGSDVALRRGGIRFLAWADDALVFERTHPTGCTIVHLARDAHAPIALELQAGDLLHHEGGSEVRTTSEPAAHGAGAGEAVTPLLEFTASGPGVSILRLSE